MKRFPSYAANPEKRQLSFCSPKSAILPSAISNFDDPVPIGSSDWHHFFFPAWYGGWRLKVIREIGGDEGKRGRHQENLKKKGRKKEKKSRREAKKREGEKRKHKRKERKKGENRMRRKKEEKEWKRIGKRKKGRKAGGKGKKKIEKE